MPVRFASISIFLALILSGPIFAHAEGAYFGAEWTFTNDKIIADNSNAHAQTQEQYRRDWIQEIVKRCPDCRIENYRVTSRDGFWFEIGTDSHVLEVTAKRLKLPELKALRNPIQNWVWDAARSVGLRPHERIGGGHIHLDIEGHFQKDARLFRNFIVDIMNHPELFMGVFNVDYLNAPPVSILGEEALRRFDKLFKQFDKNPRSIDELKRKISRIYEESFHPVLDWGLAKYHAINVEHKNTLELRGFRPQISIDHYIAILEILSEKIESLRNHPHLVAFDPPNWKDRISITSHNDLHRYSTRLPSEVLLIGFSRFLEKTQISPQSFAPFLTKDLKGTASKNNINLFRAPCSEIYAIF